MNLVKGITNFVNTLTEQEGQIENLIPKKGESFIDFTVKALTNIGKFFNKGTVFLDQVGKDFNIKPLTNLIKPLNLDDLFTSSAAVLHYGETFYKSSNTAQKIDNLINNTGNVNLENTLDQIDNKTKGQINNDNLLERLKEVELTIAANKTLNQEEKDQLHQEKIRLLNELKNRLDLLQQDSLTQVIAHAINGIATGVIVGSTIATLVDPKLMTVTPFIIAGAGIAKSLVKKQLKAPNIN